MTQEEAQEKIVELIREQMTEQQWNELVEFVGNGGKVECQIEENEDGAILHLSW